MKLIGLIALNGLAWFCLGVVVFVLSFVALNQFTDIGKSETAKSIATLLLGLVVFSFSLRGIKIGCFAAELIERQRYDEELNRVRENQ